MIGNRLWDLAAGVTSQITTRGMEALLVVTFAIPLVKKAGARVNNQPSVQTQILLNASSSWDGEPHQSYPSGQPELSVLKITLAPHTQLEWHSHPMPSAAYIVAGKLTLERKRDGKKQCFTAGQVASETVDTFHRGAAGSEPLVLIVFYAGRTGLPLTMKD
jgi:quercetin dioxygenase-like cupin family protein